MAAPFNPQRAAEHMLELAADIEIYLPDYADAAAEIRTVGEALDGVANDYAAMYAKVTAERRGQWARWRAARGTRAVGEPVPGDPPSGPQDGHESAKRAVAQVRAGRPVDRRES